MFGGGWDDAFTVNGSSESAALAAVAVTAAWLFFVHSLYALGGAFFRRRQFVLTSITVCILGFIGSILFVHFVDNFHADFQLSWITALAWTGTAVFAALGLLDWWLAYWIFRRMQAVNNKWVNL